jgi:hypothetical protein
MVSSDVHARDGNYGRKLFYEARGYIVTDCYNQRTDNDHSGSGFTYAMYKAEIDAGHPVMINLTGHTIVGVGYSDPDTIYINDTWDTSTHSMTWGGSHAGMAMWFVNIVHLTKQSNWPVNLKPLDGALIKTGVSKVKMSRKAPTGFKTKDIKNYEAQLADDALFSHIVAARSLKKTQWTYSGLLPNTPYYWRARAIFKNGSPGSWSSDDHTTSFSTRLTRKPALKGPGNKSRQIKPTVKLAWKRPAGCPKDTTYTLQYSTDPTFSAGVSEVTGLTTTARKINDVPVSAAPGSTLYYWRVKAMDAAGTKDYSDWSAARSFKR